MKVLIVGADKIFSIENFFVRHLTNLGLDVRQFTSQNLFNDYYQEGVSHKILFRLGLSSIYRRINDQFKNEVDAFGPDVIWVFKGMELFPESLRWAKKKKIFLANYNPDNPFVFSGRGSGNANITKSIGLYDLHFTYNLEIKNRLEKDYSLRTVFLPFGFDVNESVYEACAREREICAACFLGNPDSARAEFISNVVETGVDVHVYGNDWEKYLNQSRVTIHPHIVGDDVWKVFRKYRIQLNLMRMHNLQSHNMRTFEVPGIGGIMIAPDTAEHRMFFDEGKEIFLFRNVNECSAKIKSVLSLSPDEANVVRHAARAKSLRSGYRYQDRALEVMKELQKLTNIA
jgi:spore maturation protein CgeB